MRRHLAVFFFLCIFLIFPINTVAQEEQPISDSFKFIQNNSDRIDYLQRENAALKTRLEILRKKVDAQENSDKEQNIKIKELSMQNTSLSKDFNHEIDKLSKDIYKTIEKQELLVQTSSQNSNDNYQAAINTINGFNIALYNSQMINTYILIGFLLIVILTVVYTLASIKKMTKRALEKENKEFLQQKINEANRDFEKTLHGMVSLAVSDVEKKIGNLPPKEPKHHLMSYDEFYMEGQQLSEQGKMEAAIENFNKAILLNPEQVKAYYAKGLSLSKMGNYEDAIKNFDRAIEQQPNMYKAYNHKGLMLMELKEYERAIEVFESVIKLNKSYYWAYNNKGIALYHLDKFEESIELFNKAIELNPRFSNAYHNRASAYLAMKKNDLAIKDFSKAVELDGGLTTAHPH